MHSLAPGREAFRGTRVQDIESEYDIVVPDISGGNEGRGQVVGSPRQSRTFACGEDEKEIAAFE